MSSDLSMTTNYKMFKTKKFPHVATLSESTFTNANHILAVLPSYVLVINSDSFTGNKNSFWSAILDGFMRSVTSENTCF